MPAQPALNIPRTAPPLPDADEDLAGTGCGVLVGLLAALAVVLGSF